MVQHHKGKMPAGAEASLLKQLVDDAPHLYLHRNTVRTREQRDVPVNKWNIPLREEMIRLAVGSVAASHVWLGRNDVHHIAWPFSAYRALSTDDFESVGEAYRSTAGVKVRGPRQLHEYFHLYMPQPPIPEEDVMVQYLDEEVSGRRLAKVVALTPDEYRGQYVDESLEAERLRRYLDELSRTREAEVGHLPPHEMLQTLQPAEARVSLSGMLRILDFRNLDI